MGASGISRYDRWTSEVPRGRKWSLWMWCSLTVSKSNADSVSMSQRDCHNQPQVKLLPVCRISTSASASASTNWCCSGVLASCQNATLTSYPDIQISNLDFLWATSLLLTLKRRLTEIMFESVAANSTVCSDTIFLWMIRNQPQPDSHSLMNLSIPALHFTLPWFHTVSVKPVAIETRLYNASLYHFLWKALPSHILDICARIQRYCSLNKR